MAISHDATSSTTWSASTSSVTLAHTVAGTNLLMIVNVGFRRSATQSVTGITYNGVALTAVPSGQLNDASGATRNEMWYLIAPGTGTHNLVITTSATTPAGCATVSTYTGVHQTVPLGTVVTATNTSAAPSATVTTAATGQIVVDGVIVRSNASGPLLTVGAGQNSRANVVSGNSTTDMLLGRSDESGAASTVMSWSVALANGTASSNQWVQTAIALQPVTTGQLQVSATGIPPLAQTGTPTISGGAPALERWVDFAAGTDSTSRGSQAQPWKTIDYAVANAPANCTVYVKATGHYTRLTLTSVTRTGLVIQNAPGEFPIWDGHKFTTVSGITVRGLLYRGTLQNQVDGTCTNLVFDGNDLTDPTNGQMQFSVVTGGQSFISVTNNSFHDIDNSANVQASGNAPTLLTFYARGVAPTDITVQGNSWLNITACDCIQISGGSTSSTNVFERFLFDGNSFTNISNGGTAAHTDSIQNTGFSDAFTISNNLFNGPDSGRCLIQPNASNQRGDHTNFVVTNNRWCNQTDFCFSVYNAPGFQFINNTIAKSTRRSSASPTDWNTALRINYRWATSPDRPTTGVVLKNNILDEITIDARDRLTSSTALASEATIFGGGARGDNVINVINGSSAGTSYTMQGSDVRVTSAQMDTQMFVNAPAGDVTLKAAAPAIDVADPAYAPPTDALGRPRGALPDAGALELHAAISVFPGGIAPLARTGTPTVTGGTLQPVILTPVGIPPLAQAGNPEVGPVGPPDNPPGTFVSSNSSRSMLGVGT